MKSEYGKLFCCAHVFQCARQSGRLREEVVKSMKSMSVSKSFVCLFVITSGYFLLTLSSLATERRVVVNQITK